MSKINQQSLNTNAKLDKKVYDRFEKYGIIIKVRDNKLPSGQWKNKTSSDKYNSNSNYALMIVKSQELDTYLTVLDIDVKKGSVGLESMEKLSKQLDINLDDFITCMTPSGGYHIYIESQVIPTFYNKASKEGLTEDIDIFCQNNRNGKNTNYFLLPTNIGIKSKDKDGNDVIGEYKYDETKIITGETANILITKLNMILKDDNNTSTSNSNTPALSNKLDDILDSDIIQSNRAKIHELLPYIKSYSSSYNDWVDVGGYIKKAGGNSKLFHEFSLYSSKYNKSATDRKWKELPTDIGNGIGSLVFIAREEFLKEAEIIISNCYSVEEFEALSKDSYIQTFIKLDYLFNDEVKNKLNEIFVDNYTDIIFESPSDNIINKCLYNIKPNSVLNEYAPNTLRKYTYFTLPKVMLKEDEKTYKRVKCPIDLEKSAENVKTILNSFYKTRDSVIFIQNGKLVDNYSKSDTTYEIRFIQMLFNCFPTMNLKYYNGKEYEQLLDIEKMRKRIVGSHTYNYIEVKDLIKSGIEINHDTKTITNYKLFKPNNDIDDNITIDDKKEVVDTFNNHWDNMLEPITKWLILSRFITDTKHKNIAILAKSNTGKSFYFANILNKIGLTSNIKIDDYVKNGNGTNNFSLEEISNKYANIFDETQYFKRDLFDINNELTVRPLYSQNTTIKIGGKVFLSADGGHFKNDHLDSQIINRLTILDLKHVNNLNDNKEWQDLIKKYGQSNIYNILLEYYYTIYREYIIKLNTLSNLDIDKEEIRVHNILTNSKHRSIKEDSNNRLGEIIEEFLTTPSMIEDRFRDGVFGKIFINVETKKMVIMNAKKVISTILDTYDSDIARDKKYTQLDSIIEHVDRFIKKRGDFKIGSIRKVGLTVDLDGINLDNLLEQLDVGNHNGM